MKIIIAPAKTMKDEPWIFDFDSYPRFLDKTSKILAHLKSKSYDELKKIWSCNDKIAKDNYERLQNFDLKHSLTPAILSYSGLVFQNIGFNVLEDEDIKYLKENLKILSGFYGIVDCFSGVRPYRLEMQAKLDINSSNSLYEYWKDDIYLELFKDNDEVINLSSVEYSKIITKYLKPTDKFITIDFLVKSNGKLVQKATIAKMARGQMVRFMAQNRVQTSSELQKFDVFGFKYQSELSNDKKMVFVKENLKKLNS